MRPILLSFGRLNIYSYGFFTALGFVIAGFFIEYLARQKKLIPAKRRDYFLPDGLLLSLIVAVVAARLCFIILYTFLFPLEPVAATGNILAGGFVFYAGLFAGLLSLAWWLKRHETPILPWLDTVIVGVTAGMSVSAIGGYLNDGQMVHLGAFLGSLVLTGVAYRFFTLEKKAGKTFRYTLFLIFLLYFFLSFWRAEQIEWLGLTLSQITSLIGMGVISAISTQQDK